MSEDPGGATGVLVIRAWTDGGTFRARIRLTTDLEQHHEASKVTDDPNQVISVVSAWLAMLAPTPIESTGTRE